MTEKQRDDEPVERNDEQKKPLDEGLGGEEQFRELPRPAQGRAGGTGG